MGQISVEGQTFEIAGDQPTREEAASIMRELQRLETVVAQESRPTERPPGMDIREPFAQGVASGVRRQGNELLGLLFDAANPGAGLGQALQGQFERTEAARNANVPQTPSNALGGVFGRAGVLAPLGPATAGLQGAGRIGAAAVEGAGVGAAATPEDRTAGGLVGALTGSGVAGATVAAGRGLQRAVDRFNDVEVAQRAATREISALVDNLLPEGAEGFATQLTRSVGKRLDALRKSRNRSWTEGVDEAHRVSGGRIILRQTPKTIEALQEAVELGNLGRSKATKIASRLKDLDAKSLSALMVDLNAGGASGVLRPVQRALLQDIGSVGRSTPGIKELLATRTAYAKQLDLVETTERKILQRLFGTKDFKALRDVPPEDVVDKFATLTRSEQQAFRRLIGNGLDALPMLRRAGGVVVQRAIQKSHTSTSVNGSKLVDMDKLLRELRGTDAQDIRLETFIGNNMKHRILTAAVAHRNLIQKAQGKFRAELPFGFDRAARLVREAPHRLLARLTTGKSIEDIILTLPGQQALVDLQRASVSGAPLRDATVVTLLEIGQRHGIVEIPKSE